MITRNTRSDKPIPTWLRWMTYLFNVSVWPIGCVFRFFQVVYRVYTRAIRDRSEFIVYTGLVTMIFGAGVMIGLIFHTLFWFGVLYFLGFLYTAVQLRIMVTRRISDLPLFNPYEMRMAIPMQILAFAFLTNLVVNLMSR